MTEILILGAMALAAWWLLRRGARNLRLGRFLGSQPTLVPFSDAELAKQDSGWPLSARWPRPDRGGEELSPASRAAAYGRLARQSGRRLRLAGAFTVIVAGGWLGAVLFDAVRRTGEQLEAVDTETVEYVGQIPVLLPESVDFSLSNPLIPVAILVLIVSGGLALSVLAENREMVSRAYFSIAKAASVVEGSSLVEGLSQSPSAAPSDLPDVAEPSHGESS